MQGSTLSIRGVQRMVQWNVLMEEWLLLLSTCLVARQQEERLNDTPVLGRPTDRRKQCSYEHNREGSPQTAAQRRAYTPPLVATGSCRPTGDHPWQCESLGTWHHLARSLLS